LQDLVQRLVNSRGNRYLLDLLQEDEGILSDTITATATAATTATEDDSDYEPSNSTTNITSSDSYDTESSKDSENANHFDQINFSDSDNDNESDWTDPRIWAGHFHLCDWNFEKGADGSLVYKDLNRDQTRYTDNLGNESDLKNATS
jgi:hypothetical protein